MTHTHKTHNNYTTVFKNLQTIQNNLWPRKFQDEIEMLAAKSKILLQADLEKLTSS